MAGPAAAVAFPSNLTSPYEPAPAGLGKDRSLALAQPPAVLIWHWANFWEGWRTEDCPCVCVPCFVCPHKAPSLTQAEDRGAGDSCMGHWGFRYLENPECLPILEWSGIPACASIDLPTAREDQKLGQWRDSARHPSPQGCIGEKSGG